MSSSSELQSQGFPGTDYTEPLNSFNRHRITSPTLGGKGWKEPGVMGLHMSTIIISQYLLQPFPNTIHILLSLLLSFLCCCSWCAAAVCSRTTATRMSFLATWAGWCLNLCPSFYLRIHGLLMPNASCFRPHIYFLTFSFLVAFLAHLSAAVLPNYGTLTHINSLGCDEPVSRIRPAHQEWQAHGEGW